VAILRESFHLSLSLCTHNDWQLRWSATTYNYDDVNAVDWLPKATMLKANASDKVNEGNLVQLLYTLLVEIRLCTPFLKFAFLFAIIADWFFRIYLFYSVSLTFVSLTKCVANVMTGARWGRFLQRVFWRNVLSVCREWVRMRPLLLYGTQSHLW